MEPRIDRRQLLLLGGALALAGCAATPSTATTSTYAQASTRSPASGPSPTGPATTSGGSPPSSDGATANTTTANRPSWTPDPNDVSPQVKLIAAKYVETTVNQPAVEVVFAQYGGILTDRASVLVVTHPWPAVADPNAGTTYDVRLIRSGPTWSVPRSTPPSRAPLRAPCPVPPDKC